MPSRNAQRALMESLAPDERVLGTARLHWAWSARPWLSVLPAAALLVACAAAGGFALAGIVIAQMSRLEPILRLYRTVRDAGSAEAWAFAGAIAGVPWLAISLAQAIRGIARQRSTTVAITDRRVLTQSGTLSVTSTDLPLARIERIDVAQSIAGRMLGYGTVTICGSGAEPDELRGIAAPRRVRLLIQQALAASAGPAVVRPGTRTAGTSAEPAAGPPTPPEERPPRPA